MAKRNVNQKPYHPKNGGFNRIVFNNNTGYGQDGGGSSTPSCPLITGLTSSSLAYDSVTIDWDANGGTAFDLYYGPTPLTAPSSGTTPTTTSATNSKAITGLDPETEYDFYVRTNCGATQSAWNGPVSIITFSAELAAWANEIATVPSVGYLNIVEDDIISLQAGNNNFAKLDRLHFFDTEQRDNAYVSIVNPTSGHLSEAAGPAWNHRGFIKDGTGHLKTNFVPSVDGVNYTLNSSCFFLWIMTNVQASTVDGGAQNTTATERATIIFSRDAGKVFADLNDNGATTGGVNNLVADSIGFYSVVRSVAGTIAIWKNGVQLNTRALNATSLVDLELFILALNKDGVATFGTTRQVALYGVGSGTIDQAELYNSMLAHRNAVDAYLPAGTLETLPLETPSLMLAIPSLIDASGNGYNSTLGASLPGGFTAPTVDGDNNIVFTGLQTIKLNTGLTITNLAIQTYFVSFYCDTPDTRFHVFNIGLKWACGIRVAVNDISNYRQVNAAGVFTETASALPVYGFNLPKIQKGYNVVGFAFSATETIMYCNGIISYFSPNFGVSPADNSGWIGGFPGGTAGNAYTMVSEMKLLNGSYVQVYNYTGTKSKVKATGKYIMRDLGLSQIVYEGDSITQGFTLTTNAANWPAIISAYLIDNTSDKWASCNIGVGGRKLSAMATAANTVGSSVTYNYNGSISIDPVAPSIATGAKNIYVLLAGINDIAASETLANLQANFTSLINFRNSQGYQCFVLSVTSDMNLTAGKETIRLQYNAWLATQEAILNFVFIDTCSDPNLAGQPGGPNAYFSDGVHYTPLTCSIVAPMVYNAIIANI